MEYIQIPRNDLMFNDRRESFRIDFFKRTPDTTRNRFRVEAKVDLFYKFWGPFIKPKRFVCFDVLMKRFGFPMDRKQVNYECSYGNEDLLISRLNIAWEKEVEIPSEELEDCERKKELRCKPGGGLEIC